MLPMAESRTVNEAEGLIEFIDASASPYHACSRAAEMLQRVGFSQLEATAEWPEGGSHYVSHGGTLIAWSTPRRLAPSSGFRMVVAHTDSPNLRIRPQPDLTAQGFRQIAVDVYGGALLNSWLDRDLGISGRVVISTSAGHEVRLLRVGRPILRIPQLAPHLGREVHTEGVRINAQTQLVPIWALDRSPAPTFSDFLAEEIQVDPKQVLSWELMAHDLVPASLVGVRREFISAPRLDNLGSTYAATRALAEHAGGAESGAQVAVICLFDHEEVGSRSSSGAASSLLGAVLERIVMAQGGGRDDYLRALAGTICVSANMTHAVNPNYPERSEPGHPVRLNQGPAIKVNVGLRYATDALGAAAFTAAADRAGVPVQRYVARGDIPCGSTLGPIIAAQLGVDTVDVGMSQLAMHSARELCGAEDPGYMVRAMSAFLGPDQPRRSLPEARASGL